MSSKLNQMIASKYFSFFVTLALFVILYGAGMAIYKGFMRPQVFLNLFIDNADYRYDWHHLHVDYCGH